MPVQGPDLGVVEGGQGLLPPAADLPQSGAVAPLVPRQAQAAGILHTLRGHPGDPLRQDYEEITIQESWVVSVDTEKWPSILPVHIVQ